MSLHFAFEVFRSAASAFTVGRLIYVGLRTRFPFLLIWLGTFSATDLALSFISASSLVYFWAYLAWMVIYCLLSALAVRELFTLVFTHYPGIRTVGRWAMYCGLFLAIAVSFALTRLFWGGGIRGRSHLFYFEILQRSVMFSLAIVILTIIFFLSRYPLHLSRNTYISAAFFCVIFLSEAVQLLIDSLAPHLYNLYVDWSQTMFAAACLVVWGGMLQPEKERPAVVHVQSSATEEDLLRQLNSINDLLGRAAR